MRTCLTVELSPGSSLLHQPEMLGYFVESSSSAAAAAATTTADGRIINNSNINNNSNDDDYDISCCNDVDSTFIIHATRLSLSHTIVLQDQAAHASSPSPHPFAAVFVSSTITESALDDFKDVLKVATAQQKKKSSFRKSSNSSSVNRDDTNKNDDVDDDFMLSDPSTRQRLSQRLLSLVHSFLARNFTVKAIISHSKIKHPQRVGNNNISNNNTDKSHSLQLLQPEKQHAPSDIILLDLSHAPAAAIDDMLQATNCQLVHSGPAAILKILLISQLVFTTTTTTGSSTSTVSSNVEMQQQQQQHQANVFADTAASVTTLLEEQSEQHQSRTCWDIPICPVCLHRIDPRRLGLPRPENHQLCSKFCPPPNYSGFQQYYSSYYDQSEDDNYSINRHHVLSDSSSFTAAAAAYALPCAQQRLLQPWPSPSYCIACRVIDKYWKSSSSGTESSGVASSGRPRSDDGDGDATERSHNRHGIFCFQCSLQETLWVCLTCGFVGCGRYSNKHAAHHFVDAGHPYSLELATLRIWDYVAGDFATRTDLLECPSSLPLMHPWMSMRSRSGASHIFDDVIRHATTIYGSNNHPIGQADDRKPAAVSLSWGGGGRGNMNGSNTSSAQHLLHAAYDESMVGGVGSFVGGWAGSESKTPKKATMIGEEYEALLQSALEDQAQHYEGEITHLRARLTAENVDHSTMTAGEGREIESLQSEIANLRSEIDRVSRELLDSQAQEAGHRATSQRLLREQQVVQELLLKIRTETTKEHDEGQLQVEELEQQIADLTANQRMRDQFSQDEELQQAQIWGTANNNNDNNNKSNKNNSGKKTRRFFRK